jgi:integration host factor subunit beta
MTKADLIDEVSRLAELTRKDSEVIVETIFDSIVHSLRAGDKIEIRGFGSFRTRQRKPRVGRNPKTGDRVEVPAKKIPFFKPSKELKDMVNDAAGAGVCKGRRPWRPFCVRFSPCKIACTSEPPPSHLRTKQYNSWASALPHNCSRCPFAYCLILEDVP